MCMQCGAEQSVVVVTFTALPWSTVEVGMTHLIVNKRMPEKSTLH